MSAVEKGWEDITGQTAARQASKAGETAVAAQTEGLEYLKETEAVPQAFREAGLQQLGALAGFSFDPETGQATYTGDTSAQQSMIDAAKLSPLYSAMMSGQQAGEEAILRTTGATGGLRGGATISDLAEFNLDLQNQALLESYGQQQSLLSGLAQQPTQAAEISRQHGQIGQTGAQAQIAAAQAQQQGLGNLLSLGGTLGAAYLGTPGSTVSDIRLKTNIKYLIPTAHPEIHFYQWEWLPESGKSGGETGYLAQEVKDVYPGLVAEGEDGYYRINRDELERKLKALEAE